MKPLEFVINRFEHHQSGNFCWGEERQTLFDEFYDALELLEGDEVSRAKASLNRIIKKDPEFIDAYNHLAFIEFERRNFRKALELYTEAAGIAEKVIPDGFNGLINWGHLDNRPFLRSLHGAGLCYLEMGKQEFGHKSL